MPNVRTVITLDKVRRTILDSDDKSLSRTAIAMNTGISYSRICSLIAGNPDIFIEDENGVSVAEGAQLPKPEPRARNIRAERNDREDRKISALDRIVERMDKMISVLSENGNSTSGGSINYEQLMAECSDIATQTGKLMQQRIRLDKPGLINKDTPNYTITMVALAWLGQHHGDILDHMDEVRNTFEAIKAKHGNAPKAS